MKSNANKYTKTTKLGEGTYGVVYRAKDQKGQEIYALKKIRLQAEEEGIPSTAIREISLLKELNHKNIVKLYDVLHTPKKLTLVFEYVEQDLKKVIDASNGNGLEIKLVKSYLYQLLKGIEYIHKHKVLHRDLKPQNLLVSKDNIIKIADFGLARGFGLPIKNFRNDVVSLWYRAPDILLGNENYSTSVDLWSVGCILAEMVNGGIFFQGYSEKEQIQKIFKMLGTPNIKELPIYEKFPGWKEEEWEKYPRKNFKELVPRLSDDGIDLLCKLLEYDPEKRISAADALEHPFFKDIDQKTLSLYNK